jgi:hypothetical protein
LEQYNRERNQLANIIKENPNIISKAMWKILSCDGYCMFLLGEGNKDTAGKCPQCKNLSRLTNFDSNIITLECGKESGKNLNLIKFNNVNTYIKNKDLPLSVSRRFLTKCNYDSCEPNSINNQSTNYISFDEFSNGIMVNVLLQNTPLNNHIIKLYTGFICGKNGYYLIENPELSLYDLKLNNKIVKNIIYQLLCFFDQSSNFDFTLGNPSLNSIVFASKTIKYTYKNIKINCPVTLKLTNFNNSGITINNTRVYSSTPLAETYAKKSLYLPQISTNTDGISYFKLSNDTASFFLYLRYMGVALYSGAFDFYALIIALMTNKVFYDIVINDHKLFELWKSMWKPCCFEKINNNIIKYHNTDKSVTTEDIIEMIKGLYLRCDIVNYIMNKQ